MSQDHKLFSLVKPTLIASLKHINRQYKQDTNKDLQHFRVVAVGSFALNFYANCSVCDCTCMDTRLVSLSPEFTRRIVKGDKSALLLLYKEKVKCMNYITSQLNNAVSKFGKEIRLLKNKEGSYFYQPVYESIVKGDEVFNECPYQKLNTVNEIKSAEVSLDSINENNFCSFKVSSCMVEYENNDSQPSQTCVLTMLAHVPFEKKNITPIIQDLQSLDDFANVHFINQWYWRNTQMAYNFHVFDYTNMNEVMANFFVADLAIIILDAVYYFNMLMDYSGQIIIENPKLSDKLMRKFKKCLNEYFKFFRMIHNKKTHASCKGLKNLLRTFKPRKHHSSKNYCFAIGSDDESDFEDLGEEKEYERFREERKQRERQEEKQRERRVEAAEEQQGTLVRFNIDLMRSLQDDYIPTVKAEEKVPETLEQRNMRITMTLQGGCKSGIFIKELHKVLVDNNNCFLNGAFVFADDGGRIFNLLLESCSNSREIINRYAALNRITHDDFFNPGKFNKKLPLDYHMNLDVQFLKDNNLYNPRHISQFMQYEMYIRDFNKNNIELPYLCNPECIQPPAGEEDLHAFSRNLEPFRRHCNEARKSTKRIILFYPFRVKFNTGKENEFVKQYLYFKLETAPAVSVQHVVEMVEAYTSPPSVDDSGFPRRRERRTNPVEKEYKPSLKVSDRNFYQALGIQDVLENNNPNAMGEITRYNNYVRNNDELFVPQELSNRLLEMTIQQAKVENNLV